MRYIQQRVEDLQKDMEFILHECQERHRNLRNQHKNNGTEYGRSLPVLKDRISREVKKRARKITTQNAFNIARNSL